MCPDPYVTSVLSNFPALPQEHFKIVIIFFFFILQSAHASCYDSHHASPDHSYQEPTAQNEELFTKHALLHSKKAGHFCAKNMTISNFSLAI